MARRNARSHSRNALLLVSQCRISPARQQDLHPHEYKIPWRDPRLAEDETATQYRRRGLLPRRLASRRSYDFFHGRFHQLIVQHFVSAWATALFTAFFTVPASGCNSCMGTATALSSSFCSSLPPISRPGCSCNPRLGPFRRRRGHQQPVIAASRPRASGKSLADPPIFRLQTIRLHRTPDWRFFSCGEV